MNRIVNWVIALSMVAVAASVSAVLYMGAGRPIGEAGWIGVAALAIMVLGQFITGRARERADFRQRLDELGSLTSHLARDVGALNDRIAAADARLLNGIEDAVAERITPVVAEIRLLESLVRQIGDRVAEAASREDPPARPARPAPAPDVSPQSRGRRGAFAALGDEAFAALVADSVGEGRMELHLQPIVTLPQRKVRFYEALVRLKTRDGKLITPDDFSGIAESTGLMPRIDNMMLHRAVQIVRRLQTRDSEFGLFCNVAARSLADNAFFAQFIDFMEHNRALAPQIVFGFSQEVMDAAGPIELASLDRLSELGYRYSMDRVTRLDLDPRALVERRFRFVKLPAPLLLGEAARVGADIDPADLRGLLARHGIELIVDSIERESEVVDLLDYDVALGQGDLFSPPRPVRADILQEAAPAPPMAKAV